MSELLVIRIVPQAAVDPNTFTSGYLNPSGSGLGPLQITALDLSFDSPTPGQGIGTAVYVPSTAGPSPTNGQGSSQILQAPTYANDPASGIVQQYDVVPAVPFSSRAYIQVESVATAIIVVPSVPKFENLRILAQWGSGPGATQIPVALDYYDVATAAGPAPSLNGWDPNTSSPDPWSVLAAQKPSLYLQLPAPANLTSGVGLTLPSDGTPPPFEQLLPAVQQVLSGDPGAAVTATATATASAGSSTVEIPAATAGVVSGMTVSAPAGIPAGTTVVAFDPSSGTGKVTLNQELSADVSSGTTVTFQANIAALSLPQCQNIAYEIVWSQQPPLPTPPDPVEELYTNPPNTGPMVSANPNSNTGTPNVNPYEGDRQQFEAELKSYYTMANSTADRLTNFVYALSAAVAQEEQSLAATQMLFSFPANPSAASGGSATDVEVILGGVDTIQSPTNIGIPAGYFYALTANMPAQQIAHSSSIATGYRLSSLLASFTTAINAGDHHRCRTIRDAHRFGEHQRSAGGPPDRGTRDSHRFVDAAGAARFRRAHNNC